MPLLFAMILAAISALAQEPDPARDQERGLVGPFSPTPLYIEFSADRRAPVEFSPNAREQLRQAALLLQAPEWQGRKIAIEGHTCACGAPRENRLLARQRAEAVRDHLISQGAVPASAIYLLSWGEEKPLAAGPDQDLPPEQCERDEAHSLNRRVLIREWQPEDATSSATLVLPPAPSAQISLWYRPRGQTGAFQKLEEGMALHSGDELQVFLRAESPVYAYLFHHGSGGDWTCLFPNPLFSQEAPAANPLEPGRKYWLPRFGSGLLLDDVPGQEETLVYLSLEPDPRMERWAKEGVPWNSQVKPRGLGGIVTAVPTADSVEWYACFKFRHEP